MIDKEILISYAVLLFQVLLGLCLIARLFPRKALPLFLPLVYGLFYALCMCAKDLLVNLIEGPAAGTVFMYRYGDVFFVGCTPELLIRKKGSTVESM